MVSSIVAMNQMPAILRIFSDWDCCLKVISCRELPAQFVIWRASVCNWFSNVRRRSYRSKPVWRSKPEGVLMGDPRLEHNSAYDHKQEIGVIDVALLGIIRRWHLRDQVPLREIARRLGISRNTVRRYIRAETIEPAYTDRRPRSSLDKYTLKLSAWLKTEAVKSRKQRHTLKQLHLELRSLGYEGSCDRVAAFARRWKVDQLERVNSASKSTRVNAASKGTHCV